MALCLAAASALTGQTAAQAAATTTARASGSLPAAGGCTPVDAQGNKKKPSPPPNRKNTPWAQQYLDYPSVWKLSMGGGVKVAVIDSGVDANSQLTGHVTAGQTFTSGKGDADCVGHGTMVAGIIAATPQDGFSNSFAGVAPQATVESYKITNNPNESFQVSDLVSALNAAVAGGAKVINLSLDIAGDSPVLRQAVQNAVDQDVLVVVAAGNDDTDQKTGKPITGPFFPADYARSIPGVVSVGAIDDSGQLASFSDKKTWVSVTAPGAGTKTGGGITSTFPGGYFTDVGTSFAAPFVTGEAALIRARFPQLNAAGVAKRIESTANGAAGPGTGNGLINPVQALSVGSSGPAAAPGGNQGAVTINQAVRNRPEKIVVVALAGGAFLLAGLVIAAAITIPAGRRRRWRPGEFS